MIRIIVRTDNAGMAANVGGSVLTSYRTFDVSLPEVERALRSGHSLAHTQVAGVEVVEPFVPDLVPGENQIPF